MLFIVILVLLSVLIAYKLWDNKVWQPRHAWPQLHQKLNKKSLTLVDVLYWLAAWRWWSEPGYVVKILALKSVKKRLDGVSKPLSLRQFLGLKQWIWTASSISFVLWLWFGKTSVDDGLVFVFCVLLLVLVPDLYLLALRSKTERQIGEEVPFFLDLLTLTLQGGSNLEQALLATIANYPSALGNVMGKKLAELDWGRNLDELFGELKTDIPDADFQHFLSSLLRAKKLGVSLSDTLSIQAELLRTRRRQKAEELSRTAAVKISVPLVLFIFPALLIIYIGPGILQLLERT